MVNEYWQKGWEKGFREGLEEARRKQQKETVFQMLSSGSLTLEDIAEYSGLPLEEVKRLSENRPA